MNERRDKINYYLDIAETVCERATCLRKKFGVVIVKNDEIIATGYNGAPRGRENCIDLKFCQREKLNIPRGQRYKLCRSVHAEANAIISAPRERMIKADMYMVGLNSNNNSYVTKACSCSMCKRLIINAGIEKLIVRDDKDNYSIFNISDFIKVDDSLSNEFGY